MNPDGVCPSHFLKIHFNITHPSIPRSSKWPLSRSSFNINNKVSTVTWNLSNLHLYKYIYLTEGKGYFCDCKQLRVVFRKKGVILYYRIIHMECSEIWYWGRIVKISWTDHVRNKEVLLRVKKQRK